MWGVGIKVASKRGNTCTDVFSVLAKLIGVKDVKLTKEIIA